MHDAGPGPTTFRRRVFYIPGYDPIPPRRYRELYRREGAMQAAVSGYALALTPKTIKGSYGWQVTGQGALAEIDVLVWSDIVQGSMNPSILSTYGQLLRTVWTYVGSGAIFRLMRLRKGPMLAGFYPIGMLLAQLVAALLLGWASGSLVADLHPVLGWMAGLAMVWAVLRLARRHDNRLFAYYLMHDYAYSAQSGGANPPELEARMAAFGQSVASALQGAYDEVLVIGHSSGAHIAISVLADLIRAGLPDPRPALALLTLGHVVPMVSFLPRATRLRADLHHLATRDELTWVDVTAPGDGCSFALCDPVAVSGVAPPGKTWPLVVSAAFTQTLSPSRWRELRWRFFRLHFQYLCAFDQPGDYDYFQITAGPLTLADRYRGRKPSDSRIETPLSGYRSMA